MLCIARRRSTFSVYQNTAKWPKWATGRVCLVDRVRAEDSIMFDRWGGMEKGGKSLQGRQKFLDTQVRRCALTLELQCTTLGYLLSIILATHASSRRT